LLVPHRVRTWAPRGQTPHLRVVRGRRHKISAISALTASPRRRKLALYAHFYRDQNLRAPEVAHFLRHLLRHLRGPVVLLWDDGTIHKGCPVKIFLPRHPRLLIYRFPGYAPELNPVEFVWTNLKRALANSVPEDDQDLKRLLHPPLQRLRQSQNLLWSCIEASDLPW
jgi:transposase